MKIAIYSDTYYPTVDGVVVSISYLRRELIKRSNKCIMVVPNQSIKGNYTRSHLFLPSVPFWGYKDYRSAVLPSMEFRYLKKFDPDILNLHGIAFTGFKGIRDSYRLKKPVISMYHTNIMDSLHYLSKHEIMRRNIGKLIPVYLDWFLRNSDVVVFPSVTAMNEITEKIGKKTRYEIIPNAIDTTRLNIYPSKPKKMPIKGNVKLLFVGRIALEKKLDVVLKAMKLLPENYILNIAGNGPALEHYTKMSRNLGIDNRVNFLGYISDEKLSELYSNSHVFVIPSTFETQGMVALESLYMHTPVVGANYRGLQEIIKDDFNGYRFSQGESSEMAEKILNAVDNIERLSNNARKSVSSYMPEVVIEKFISLFKEFV